MGARSRNRRAWRRDRADAKAFLASRITCRAFGEANARRDSATFRELYVLNGEMPNLDIDAAMVLLKGVHRIRALPPTRRSWRRMNRERKVNMNARLLPTAMMAGALLSCVGGGVASAQQPAGQTAGGWGQSGTTFALHSNAGSGCPALDWHLVVMNDGTLAGMVGVNDMKTMFRVHGTYSGANFHLDGQEVGGTRTAAVNGQLQEGRVALTIGGLPVDSACQGKTVYIKRREAAPVGGEG
jgi:hypothetical protein